MKRKAQLKHNLALGLALLAVGAVSLTGCGKEEPPPPPPKKAPPPPPPKPDRVLLAPLMQGADPRVQFPQEKAPYDRDLAEAVIAFASALADGDDLAMSEWLDENGRSILDGMLADGTWFETVEKIEAVRVVYLGQQPDEDEDASFAEFVLAVQEPGGAYTLGWEANATAGGWVMSSLYTADGMLPRASDWDGESIGAYESASGWGATGTSLPTQPDTFASSLGPDAAIAAYFSQETMRNLLGSEYDKLAAQTDMTAISKAAGMNITEEMVEQLLGEGEKLIKSGSRPNTMVVKMLVTQLSSIIGPAIGKSWDKETILEAMAKALDISIDEMKELHDG